VSSGFGAIAVREESALLAGLQAAPFDVSGAVAVRLLGSPLDPSTAQLRMLDPALPLDLRNSRISVLAPGEAAVASLRLVTAVRDDTGRYTVTSEDALP
jgi:hypothetical protein